MGSPVAGSGQLDAVNVELVPSDALLRWQTERCGVLANLIERTVADASARNNAFTPTEVGAALRPILEGLADWPHGQLREFHDGISSIASGAPTR